MKIPIDPKSPVPLYHQISEAIRYRIATGELKTGSRLTSVRQAAAELSVNMHTVRRAYQALAEQGVVEIRGAGGTVVRGLAAEPGVGSRTPQAGRRVTVVECSQTQAVDLAEQLEHSFEVCALPRSLEHDEPLPEGDVLATFFHYNDIRRRWPQRLNHVSFVTIQPDPAVALRLRSRFGGVSRAFVCEREPTMAGNIGADLSVCLPDLRLDPLVCEEPAAFLSSPDPSPRLMAPRIWGQLTPTQRGDERALEVRYIFDAGELKRVAATLGWASAAPVGVHR